MDCAAKGGGRRRVRSALAGGLLAAAVALPARGGWIVAGGGGEPESNQVSLEQDAALAARTFGGRGTLLFGGGADSPSVQVLDPQPRGDALLTALGTVFDPRSGRDSHYRKPRLPAARPATLDNLEEALGAALRRAEPLLLYLAAHGEKGEQPRDNRVILWGGHTLTAAELAALLEQQPAAAPVRVVITSCYSGGFAEIAFAGADPARGAAAGERCGLFAAAWDEEASGCDPNPDRGAQEGYGIHFLHALRGEDRSGARLAATEIDLDGDGRIGLLEAHTRARIVSASFDTPTTTSERWLRHAAPAQGDEKQVRLPEEETVLAGLGRRLELRDRAAAEARLAELDRQLEEAERRWREAADQENERALDLRIRLLERWPVLDDPWHPDFASTVKKQGSAIRKLLDRSPEAAAYLEAREAAHEAAEARDLLRLERSIARRLVRAYENLALAARLAAHGGEPWRQFERLRACERGAP